MQTRLLLYRLCLITTNDTFLQLCNFFTFHNSSVFISECLVHKPVDQRIRSSGYEQQVIVHQMGPSWQCNVTNIQSPDDADGNPQKAIYSDDRKHHFSSVYLVHSACETVFIWPCSEMPRLLNSDKLKWCADERLGKPWNSRRWPLSVRLVWKQEI